MSTWQAHGDAEGITVGMVFKTVRRWRTRVVKVIGIRRQAGHIHLAKGHLVATIRDTKTGREREVYCATLAEPRKWKLIKSPVFLHDLMMHIEMFNASPEGQAQRKADAERFERLSSDWPDETIEFNAE